MISTRHDYPQKGKLCETERRVKLEEEGEPERRSSNFTHSKKISTKETRKGGREVWSCKKEVRPGRQRGRLAFRRRVRIRGKCLPKRCAHAVGGGEKKGSKKNRNLRGRGRIPGGKNITNSKYSPAGERRGGEKSGGGAAGSILAQKRREIRGGNKLASCKAAVRSRISQTAKLSPTKRKSKEDTLSFSFLSKGGGSGGEGILMDVEKGAEVNIVRTFQNKKGGTKGVEAQSEKDLSASEDDTKVRDASLFR